MLTLFFVDDLPTQIGSLYEFDSEDAHHAVRVLRMAAGDTFMLADGTGAWSQVKAFAVKKKSMEVEVIASGFQEALPTTITVVQALPKSDRAKEAIELLTEAGVDRIVPWASSRSIGKASDKFSVTAREASKQSRRLRIPEVTDIATTSQICEAIALSDLAIVFHESAEMKLSDCISSHNVAHLLIIIGPEGGITPTEIDEFKAAGAKVALMGRPILRSAHAGIAAVAAISALLKVW
ncbi:MAG: 16S rRNA (uracil(1498)-N(3))-methyltransferase [Actinobacteria bacterium]|jgi:16S rRNA (uracil1498-N3)-methyltransferase|uniref:16S rRNA (uracil(1498)-N(3))-methyltransferase n=1 Tax=freshwater metagenome TaxID=449393 RepID=A0A6J7ST03_9ZZZZ|nr:16S rRNA (uracil(1498)-N(3))-methyltransferase [Actinomycetota bacterium]MSY35693.1 16S rRNA (uracil(1498)-N(3))-methyltransferase [Actinomycetota bacterium]MTA72959.1 16S rRNA (uracil(1498)-N(3))-methyltransferase [Actinomycetota bacterium]MTB29863.1 16S rRNA (uracil(1498)-N(3))-methyltransferase [Actinomycetota bacterium]MUH49123.1 16S rRNA (uracil(1498)-N(3))-methyltransferase [Actinomycetota bacterium]